MMYVNFKTTHRDLTDDLYNKVKYEGGRQQCLPGGTGTQGT